ncbi:MAG: ATP-binding protein [Cellvibrionaceae bacterium]
MKNIKQNPIKGLGKYKAIAFFITVFIVLILGLLGLNLFISNELQKNSKEINIAASQASLVQEISKDIYTIISQYQKVLPYESDKERLSIAMLSFDERLKAFLGDGSISNNNPELPKKMLNPEGLKVLNQAKSIWSGYIENIFPIFERNENTQAEFLNALTYSDRYNQELTSLMNDLATIIQEDSEGGVLILRVVQIIGIVLAVFSFLFIIFYFVKYLRKSDYEVELAQEETSGILRTVREGLFLLDEDFIIGNQCSNEMKEIFESDDISGLEFSSLLKRIVPKDKVETVQNFVKLLFDPDVIEDLIGSLNPLDNIEVNFADPEGNSTVKYLDFAFYRVMSRDNIDNVLVSVRDMTDQHKLKQELEDSKAESNTRMVILDEFLQADSESVDRFLINTRSSLSNINLILKEDSHNIKDFGRRLDKIFVEIHRIKGESTTLGFSHFSEKSHEFETELDSLKKVNNVQGINFLPLTIKLDELIKASESIEKISSSISQRAAKQPISASNQLSNEVVKRRDWEHLSNLVSAMSKEYGKGVNLVMTGFAESNLTKEYHNLINNLSIQLIKNSLIHGIENEHERLERNKNPIGRIDLILSKLPNGDVELVMKDDGRGFNIEKIKQKLVESRLLTPDEADTWTKDKLVRKAFATGFSTADQVDMNAGRGVGLDVIKDSITEVGGKLSLRQADGKYCQFNILLPVKAA